MGNSKFLFLHVLICFLFFISFASSSSSIKNHPCQAQQSLALHQFKQNLFFNNVEKFSCRNWLGLGYQPQIMNLAYNDFGSSSLPHEIGMFANSLKLRISTFQTPFSRAKFLLKSRFFLTWFPLISHGIGLLPTLDHMFLTTSFEILLVWEDFRLKMLISLRLYPNILICLPWSYLIWTPPDCMGNYLITFSVFHFWNGLTCQETMASLMHCQKLTRALASLWSG